MTRGGGDSSGAYVPCPSSNKGDRGYTLSVHALQGEKKNEATKGATLFVLVDDVKSSN
jgi:hypothetical protein